MATFKRSDYRKALRRLVPDEKALDPDDLDAALDKALLEFSVSRPNALTSPPSRHVISEDDADDTTVSDDDFWILVQLAAAYLCEFLAIVYTPTVGKMPQTDYVALTEKTREYETRAKTLRKNVSLVLPASSYIADSTADMPTMFTLARGRRGA